MLSVVMPTYNEAVNILPTIQEVLDAIAKTSYANDFEILIIDDHSSDGTFDLVRQLNNPCVHGIRLSQRVRSHTAIRAGIREAKGEVILCMSADGQDDPNALGPMLEKWKEGAQVVWAYRRNDERVEEPFLSKMFALMFYRVLAYLTRPNQTSVDLCRGDFFLLDRKAADAMSACNERDTSLFGLLAWLGFNQTFVEYYRRPRRTGISKWDFSSKVNLASNWIMGFSGVPLRAIGWIGLVIAIAGFTYALLILVLYFTAGHVIAGWSSLMVVVLVLGGTNIAMLGVIGQYLWRTLEESRHRPLYFIEDRIGQKDRK